MNTALEKAQAVGLLDHMVKGAIRGGFIGVCTWQVAKTAAQLFPPSAPVLVPAALTLWAVGATAGAFVEGGAYVAKCTAKGVRVRS